MAFKNPITKAQKDYNAILSNQSLTARGRLQQAINFNAERRPGADLVREKQAHLRRKLLSLSARVNDFGSACLPGSAWNRGRRLMSSKRLR